MANPPTSTIQLQASGLATEPNELSAPPGSFSDCNNVIIKRDSTIESRRGYKLYGEPFGSISDRADQLIVYKNSIIRHYNDVLQWDTGVLDVAGLNIFDTFFGSYSDVTPGLRIKSIQANGNLYFTTSTGIQKISATNSSQFSTAAGYITPAGGIEALDPTANLVVTLGSSTGFLPDDAVVAYRILWGTNDANGNLIYGTPSGRVVVYNSLQEMNVRDMMRLLQALDNLNVPAQSNILNQNFVQTFGLPLDAPATEIQTNLISLATTLDTAQPALFGFSSLNVASIDNLQYLTVTLNSTGDGLYGRVAVGDAIYLGGTWNDSAGLNISGVYTISQIGTIASQDYIKFLTTDINPGIVSFGADADIETGWFRSIPQPPVPDSPATNTELVDLQNYLQAIITELQTNRNTVVGSNTTSTSFFPLQITSATIATNVVTINNSSAAGADATNVYVIGDKISLVGTWNVGADSIDGYGTVQSIASATQITVSSISADSGTITLGTDSEVEIIKRFSDALQAEYINGLEVTLSANVELHIPIPVAADNSNYFFQIYRSSITQAATTDVLADLVPDDELQQVYEAFPTAAQIAAGFVDVLDDVPQSFFQGGAFLYTDENNGQGILQENNAPPLATDITVFQNVAWYANTQSKYNMDLNLLGINDIVTDALAGDFPSISIVSGESYNTYTFVEGVNQVTDITLPAGSVFPTSGAAYFLLNGGTNLRQYYVWFNVQGATNVDPMVSGLTGIEVTINSGDANTVVAQDVANALNVVVDDFSATVTGNVVTVTDIVPGITTNISPTTASGTMTGVTGYSASVTTEGNGQNISNQVTTVDTIAGGLFTPTGAGDYFTINTAFDDASYYIWFNVNSANSDPKPAGFTGLQVPILSTDTAAQVATKLTAAINTNIEGLFTAVANSNVATITNTFPGPAADAMSHVVDGSFTVTTTSVGALDVLLSNSISPSLAVQETAQSLVQVINANNAEIVYAFYISGVTDIPGKLYLEERTISNNPFYVIASSANVGGDFSPAISPTAFITAINASNPTTITTAAPHGFIDGQTVVIADTNSFPVIGGVYTVSGVTSLTFQIQADTLTAGTKGVAIATSNAQVSSNNLGPSKLYYSKYLQPEAVPAVNFLSIGLSDKAILRIIPLRSSLFVMKEDGVYRVTGQAAPWTVTLFDSSYILIAPDSVSVANNVVYGWTTQGIMSLTESGSQIISRLIDVDILPLATQQYTNFSTATWGIGYNSDYSYLVWTVTNTTDTVATQAYMYNNLTSTWVNWDKSNTCGIVDPVDNKLYLGAGDTNSIEQERKDFLRTDYADRETTLDIQTGNYVVDANQLKLFQLSNVNNFNPGDVITQEQTVTIYDYNNLLLKLDADPQVDPAIVPVSLSYDAATQMITASISSIPSNFNVGDSFSLQNVNPVVFNGTYTLTSVDVLSNLYFNVMLNSVSQTAINPGMLTISLSDTLTAEPGDDMRIDLENLVNQLAITPGLEEDYVDDIGDYTFLGLSVSATNPAVFSMPSFNFSSTSVVPSMGIINLNNDFAVNQIVSFSSSGSLPGGLEAGSVYFLQDVTGTTFKVSTTKSGSPIIFTSAGSSVMTLQTLNYLLTNRFVEVINSTTTPNIDGQYSITQINQYQFSIPIAVLTAGTADVETLVESFQDIQASYNITVNNLNLDSGAAFSNYSPITTTTLFETPISDINYPLKQLSLTVTLPFILGPIIVYEAINSSFEYNPITMNDALSLKQFREATVMYIDKTFTTATLNFASDLLPELEAVPINGLGGGLQGNDDNGENYYGGNSNSAPFRTYIPSDKARCRYLIMQHVHQVAREKYSVLGSSVTGRIVSTRGYR